MSSNTIFSIWDLAYVTGITALLTAGFFHLRHTRNTVVRKRIHRFIQRKRAIGSLILLIVLFGISLIAEFICNDKPLIILFEGKTYFPIFRFYSSNEFLGDGRYTRPDYKALARSPAFTENRTNRIIWPPIPFSPFETIEPESLSGEEQVELTLKPLPHVGSIDLLKDGRIKRATAAGWFFDKPDRALRGKQIADLWPLSPALQTAIDRRFRNESAPAISSSLAARHGKRSAVVSLSPFTARSRPPRSIRLIFRRPPDDRHTAHFIFARGQSMPTANRADWNRLPETIRDRLTHDVAAVFVTPQPAFDLLIDETRYQVRAEKNDVRWPHAPVPGHWFGIDSAGRDVLVRILYGLRTSLSFGLLLVIFSMAAGTVMGALQGYYAGKVDLTVQRLIEIWSAIPFLYVMILMGSVYGRSFGLLLFCYGLFNWIGISYYVRAEFLRLRKRAFVDAAHAAGIPAGRIILRHILPNALTPVITFFPFSLVGAIGSLAALDYLGFGLPPPTPSWGELLHQAQAFRWAWWLILYPSLALFTVMLLGVFIGEGVRDAYDPRPFSRLR